VTIAGHILIAVGATCANVERRIHPTVGLIRSGGAGWRCHCS
jgi:hypothetical protein